MNRILLTGRNGQVGWELHPTLGTLGEIIAPSRQELDLTESASIRETIRKIKPAWIVNAAAYTAVDKAESEPELAMAINAHAPGIMAEEAKRIGAAMIHYSTDYVFDGTKTTPYTEDDAPNPLSVYGKTKLAGEEAIRAAGVPHLILRTSWVYAARGKNFLLTILRLAKERDELRIVGDQVGAPTWSRSIAEATAQIMARSMSPHPLLPMKKMSGVYHLTAAGDTSWFGFAEEILREKMQTGNPCQVLDHGKSKLPKLISIPSSEYPVAAERPHNSRLACEKLKEIFGIFMPDWKVDLSLCLQEIVCHGVHAGAPHPRI